MASNTSSRAAAAFVAGPQEAVSAPRGRRAAPRFAADARMHPETGHPPGLDRPLDLGFPGGPHPGHRGGGRRPYSVHPPSALARGPRGGDVSPVAGLRPPPAGDPPSRVPGPAVNLRSPVAGVGGGGAIDGPAGLRVGGAVYARENGSFGATTLLKRHVKCTGDKVYLRFTGKSGGTWGVSFRDQRLASYLAALPCRRASGPAICHPADSGRGEELASRHRRGGQCLPRPDCGPRIHGKDFRTWQGTVVAALSLARSFRSGQGSPAAVTPAVQEAVDWLHNTPAVARDSYVDPRVIELFDHGKAADARRQPDRAVSTLPVRGQSAAPR
ncbi:hypothetical protein J2T21_003916 [Paeniglutamicibacter psychrophenolicus]|nr:hypothetical protein [Paeniglutamicibacter psychrophenolicus]